MSQTNYSLTPLITEAERVLKAATTHFRLNVDPAKIVVTIQSAGRKRALGWFGADHWKNGKPGALHEINLSAEHLKTCDMGELLIHELAHAENRELGIKDCAARRHNRKFKTMAERLGLLVDEHPDKSVGYGYTKLGEPAKAFLKKIAFKHKLFAMARQSFGARTAPGSRLVKVSCLCGYTVRVTRKWLDVGMPVCPCGEEMAE